MDPTETLVAIDKSQLKVEIVDGNLHVSPMDSIPPDLLEAIKANKEGIAEILKLGRHSGSRFLSGSVDYQLRKLQLH